LYSSVIVLATVSSQTITGPTLRIADNENVRLEKIDLDVEGVLKGKIDSSQISFYRYRWYDDWIKQSPAIDAIALGDRSVFFLDRTPEGQLRAAFDVTVSRASIVTGRHDPSRLSSRPIDALRPVSRGYFFRSRNPQNRGDGGNDSRFFELSAREFRNVLFRWLEYRGKGKISKRAAIVTLRSSGEATPQCN
jgi:hypothetical protein